MSRVSALKQWKNSDTVNAKDYVLERDRISTAVNDNYERILGLTNFIQTSLTRIGDVDNYNTVSVSNYIVSTAFDNFTINLPDEIEGTLVQFLIKDMGTTVTFVGDAYTFQADDTYEGVTLTMIYSGGTWFYTTYSSNKHTHEKYDYNKSGWEPYTTANAPFLQWDRVTRTLSYTNPNNIRYWSNNVAYTNAGESIQVPDTTDLYFFYYVGDTLTISTSVWNRSLGHCPVAIVSWNAEDQIELVAGFELHGVIMDWATHAHFHLVFGTQYINGLGIVLLNNTEVQYGTGLIRDEDIALVIGTLIGSTQQLNPLIAPILYRKPNGTFTKTEPGTTEVVMRDNGAIVVNTFNGGTGQWELSPVANNKHFAMWTVATNDLTQPLVLIPGQVESDTLAEAEALNDLEAMQFGDFPIEEFVVLDRLLIKRVGASYEIVKVTTYKTGRVSATTLTVGAHEHDDRYYTETEINTRSYLGTSAPTSPTLGGLWFDNTN